MVALPCRTCPIVLSSIPSKGLRHQAVGSNTWPVSHAALDLIETRLKNLSSTVALEESREYWSAARLDFNSRLAASDPDTMKEAWRRYYVEDTNPSGHFEPQFQVSKRMLNDVKENYGRCHYVLMPSKDGSGFPIRKQAYAFTIKSTTGAAAARRGATLQHAMTAVRFWWPALLPRQSYSDVSGDSDAAVQDVKGKSHPHQGRCRWLPFAPWCLKLNRAVSATQNGRFTFTQLVKYQGRTK